MYLKLLNSAIVILLTIVTFSCKKETSENGGPTNVKLNFSTTNQSNISNIASSDSEQIITTQSSNGFEIKARLIPNYLIEKENSITNKANNLAETTQIERSAELIDNAKIKILVYNQSGTKVIDIDHIYKRNEPGFVIEDLVIGNQYTFIIYSINSTTNIPTAENSQFINNVRISNLTSNILYYNKTVSITANGNDLDIVLNYAFSEVSLELNIKKDEEQYTNSKITLIENPKISPAYTKMGLQLRTGLPIRNLADTINGGKPLIINGTAPFRETITTQRTLIMTDAILRDATFKNTLSIDNIVINGNQGSIRLSNFRILPGTNYTLKLEVASPCEQNFLIQKFESNAGSPSNITFNNLNWPEDYKQIDIDFFELDNSFRLRFNEQDLFSGEWRSRTRTRNNQNSSWSNWGSWSNWKAEAYELEFQGYGDNFIADKPPTVIFSDLEKWGQNNIPEIYTMGNSSRTTPVLRVRINRNKSVSVTGAKSNVNGAPLFAIRALNNETNTIRNTTNSEYSFQYRNASILTNVIGREVQQGDSIAFKNFNNTINISQRQTGVTKMRGEVRGLRNRCVAN